MFALYTSVFDSVSEPDLAGARLFDRGARLSWKS